MPAARRSDQTSTLLVEPEAMPPEHIGDPCRPIEVGAFVPVGPDTVIDPRPGRPCVIQTADVSVTAERPGTSPITTPACRRRNSPADRRVRALSKGRRRQRCQGRSAGLHPSDHGDGQLNVVAREPRRGASAVRGYRRSGSLSAHRVVATGEAFAAASDRPWSRMSLPPGVGPRGPAATTPMPRRPRAA